MNYLPVLTKQDFSLRFAKGEFGNASPTWHDLDEFIKQAPTTELYHLRNRITGGSTFYNLKRHELIYKWGSEKQQDLWYCSQMCPTEKTLLQGEVMRTTHGLYLYGTCVAKPMREALLQHSFHQTGIMAICILQYYLCPNSWIWLNHLLDNYEGHIVEFTTLSVNWGTVPNYNTVWWECRNY